MGSAPRTQAVGLLLSLVALAATTASEPVVEPMEGRLGDAALLAASSVGEPCLMAFGDGASLRWLSSKNPAPTAAPSRLEWSLPAAPVAAATLSDSTLAVVVTASQQESPDGARLAFIRCDVVGRFEVSQEVSLPAADTGVDAEHREWSLAATPRWLFVGYGQDVWRLRHTGGGLGEPKPYIQVDATVRGMTIDGKGYLAVLAAKEDQRGELLYFDPTQASASPLASYPITLPDARLLAFARAKGDASPRLFVSSQAGLHRVELTIDDKGNISATPTAVWRSPTPIDSLAGVSRGDKAAGPLYVLAGSKLHKLTPQPKE